MPTGQLIEAPRAGQDWSEEDDETLVRLWADGTPAKTIAKQMSRSDRSVLSRREILDLPSRRVRAGKRPGPGSRVLRVALPVSQYKRLERLMRATGRTASSVLSDLIKSAPMSKLEKRERSRESQANSMPGL